MALPVPNWAALDVYQSNTILSVSDIQKHLDKCRIRPHRLSVTPTLVAQYAAKPIVFTPDMIRCGQLLSLKQLAMIVLAIQGSQEEDKRLPSTLAEQLHMYRSILQTRQMYNDLWLIQWDVNVTAELEWRVARDTLWKDGALCNRGSTRKPVKVCCSQANSMWTIPVELSPFWDTQIMLYCGKAVAGGVGSPTAAQHIGFVALPGLRCTLSRIYFTCCWCDTCYIGDLHKKGEDMRIYPSEGGSYEILPRHGSMFDDCIIAVVQPTVLWGKHRPKTIHLCDLCLCDLLDAAVLKISRLGIIRNCPNDDDVVAHMEPARLTALITATRSQYADRWMAY